MRGRDGAMASTVLRSSRVSGPTTSATPASAATASAGSTPSSPWPITRIRLAIPARLAAARKPALTASAAGPYPADSSGSSSAIVSLATCGEVIACGRGRVVTSAGGTAAGATSSGVGRTGAGRGGAARAEGEEGLPGGGVAAPVLPPDNVVVPHAVSASSNAISAATRAQLESNADAIEKGNIVMTRGEPSPVLARTLYVVATPIGNLRDITLRALDVLEQADIIAAEDTRITSTLTSQYGITARLVSLHAHNERQRADEIIAWLAAGKRVALVTDAGTPAISDPGALLVRAVADAGYAVVAVPGASAVV